MPRGTTHRTWLPAGSEARRVGCRWLCVPVSRAGAVLGHPDPQGHSLAPSNAGKAICDPGCGGRGAVSSRDWITPCHCASPAPSCPVSHRRGGAGSPFPAVHQQGGELLGLPSSHPSRRPSLGFSPVGNWLYPGGNRHGTVWH